MNSTTRLAVALASLGAMAAGTAALAADQTAPREGPGAQAAADARAPQVLAECPKGPPPRPSFSIEIPEPDPNAQVSAIPGVVKAGARWKVVWETTGNNADGIIGLRNGNVLNAQNNNSAVVEITPRGRAKTVYKDTNTGGALSMNKKGQLFVAQRGLRAAIWQLAPQRKLLADRYDGAPLDCLGGVLNDIAADNNGGVYFTQTGLFYAAPDGRVTRYGDVRPNGLVLSRDEKTLFVTSAGTVAAFDVQPDGALTNQRTFAKLPGGGGDGMTIDSEGRLYVPGYPGVRVIAADGAVLGTIPAPASLTSVTFGGPGKKTLFAVAQPVMPIVRRDGRTYYDMAQPFTPRPQILAIPMEAQGYLDRAK